MKSSIAYIDDNKLNLECIATILSSDFEIHTFNQAENFLRQYEKSSFASILVDIHMPVMDGFSLYEKLIEHPHYNGCPILFISSDESDHARIKSLVLGAVDFLDRSIGPDEMIARIKSKILFFQKRRGLIEFSNLQVNLTLLKAYLDNKELPLTFIEFKILCLVLRRYPDVVTKKELIDNVWRSGHVLDATIYTHISNLNNKLVDWDHEINALKTRGFQLIKKDIA